MVQKGRCNDPNRAPSAGTQQDAEEDTPGGASIIGPVDLFFYDVAGQWDLRAV